jgi:hypothetical protein
VPALSSGWAKTFTRSSAETKANVTQLPASFWS